MDLNQVTIYSPDVDRAIKFYEGLGLRIIVDSRPRYVRFECPDGNSTLSLHETEERPGGGIVLYFECDDLDGTVEDLAASGIEFDEPPTDRTWLWREATLKDPDGNRIILYYAGENRKDPPGRVGSE